MNKKLQILLCVAVALICLASAAAADVSLRIVDRDPAAGVLNAKMRFNVVTSSASNGKTQWLWQKSTSTDILPVDMPDVDFFKQFVPETMKGGVLAEVWAKGELQLYNSMEGYLSINTKTLNSKPYFFTKDGENTYLPLGDVVGEDQYHFDIYATKVFHDNKGVLILVDANGKVTKLTTYNGNDDGLVFNHPKDGTLVFPLKFYIVDYMNASVITASAGTGGTIDPSGEYPAEIGKDYTCVITADADSLMTISSIVVDGEPIAVTNKCLMRYMFPTVSTDHTITASFDKAAGCSGIAARLVGVIEDENNASVAALKSNGFTTGDRTITLVSGDVTTTGTFSADKFVQAVELIVDDTNTKAKVPLTLYPISGTFSKTAEYHALLLNKTTNYYDLYPATLNADGNLTMTIKPVGDYFSTGTIFVYSGTAKETGDDPTPVPEPTAESKSSSGCNAGMAALALLALVPLLDRRKK